MLTKKEILLLANLRQNGRQSITNLSKKTKMPISTVYGKLKNYEGKLIKKFTPIVDFHSIGYTARATIMLKVGQRHKQEIRQFLHNAKVVNTFYRVNNQYDYLIEVICKSLNGVQRLLDTMEGRFEVEKKEIHYILEEYKKEDFLAQPNFLALTEVQP